jgi:hypothetical protein
MVPSGTRKSLPRRPGLEKTEGRMPEQGIGRGTPRMSLSAVLQVTAASLSGNTRFRFRR